MVNRRKKNFVFVFFVLLLLGTNLESYSQETKRVLFIGNSYTHTNDLPNVLSDLAESQGKSIEHDSYTPGGAWFSNHSTNSTVISKLQQGNWDIIVLQGQSQEVAFPDGQFNMQVYPYAKTLDSLAKVNNPEARVLFYMTWGYRYGDPMNCPYYEPFCTFEGMGERLKSNYLRMVRDFHSDVSPVGAAWLESISRDSTIVLHSSDNSHPSMNGTYLAACCFYEMIYKEPIENPWRPSSVSEQVASYLINIANQVVYQNYDSWTFTQTNSELDTPLQKTESDFIAMQRGNTIVVKTKNIIGKTNFELLTPEGKILTTIERSLRGNDEVEMNLQGDYKGVCILRLTNENVGISKKLIIM